MATTNRGVCVTCTDANGNALEYFGVIEDIIKISWEGREQLDLVLFYCRWFDPTSRGVRRTENLGLVEVKHSSRLQNLEPFVLASQVTQVYYLSYASDNPSLIDWWVVYLWHQKIVCLQSTSTMIPLKLKGQQMTSHFSKRMDWKAHL